MPSPAHEPPPSLPAPTRLEPIIGGTLALLTHDARTPNLAAADKIARNLALIARHPDASAALQTVCTRLFTDWLGPLDVQDAPLGGEWRDVWPMPPLPQWRAAASGAEHAALRRQPVLSVRRARPARPLCRRRG